MRYAALLSMLLAVAGCGFAQKHPAVTIGITAGVIGFGACGMAVEKLDTCSAIAAAAGLGLGGIAGLAMLFGDTEDHALPPFEEEDGVIREGTPPPPGLPPDAGVGLAPADAGVPLAPSAPIVPSDAGVPIGPVGPVGPVGPIGPSAPRAPSDAGAGQVDGAL